MMSKLPYFFTPRCCGMIESSLLNVAYLVRVERAGGKAGAGAREGGGERAKVRERVQARARERGGRTKERKRERKRAGVRIKTKDKKKRSIERAPKKRGAAYTQGAGGIWGNTRDDMCNREIGVTEPNWSSCQSHGRRRGHEEDRSGSPGIGAIATPSLIRTEPVKSRETPRRIAAVAMATADIGTDHGK